MALPVAFLCLFETDALSFDKIMPEQTNIQTITRSLSMEQHAL
jgi:hypothetical protein